MEMQYMSDMFVKIPETILKMITHVFTKILSVADYEKIIGGGCALVLFVTGIEPIIDKLFSTVISISTEYFSPFINLIGTEKIQQVQQYLNFIIASWTINTALEVF